MSSRLGREREFHDRLYQGHSRDGLAKYYAVARASHSFYHERIVSQAHGKQILEYGCGLGSLAYDLANHGASVTGIDLSAVAIAMATQAAEQAQLNIDFCVMNAEDLQFSDNSFDIICGTSILHHLQLEQALAELARTLKPQGQAIFLEPLGHNFLINLYRRLTPQLRTPDEHPLRTADLQLLRHFFQNVEMQFFHLTTLMAVPFGRFGFYPALLGALEKADSWLFRRLPFTRSSAWIVVLVMSHPLKHAADLR
jgi:ubiquinone/menaquinone biosynthesis C-methylase UbiE